MSQTSLFQTIIIISIVNFAANAIENLLQMGLSSALLGLNLVSIIVIVLLAFIFHKKHISKNVQIQKLIQKIADDKDLSVEIAIDNTNSVSDSLSHLVEDLKGFISQTINDSIQISSSAEKLSVIIDTTNEGVRRQQSESEQVATAMNKMTATVQEVAQNANDAALASQQADEAAQAGKDIVRQSITGITNLAREVENTSSLLDRLQSETGEIDSALSVIQSIAEQTNLLALNAAIEAARAGETGRGFAVVADEVRTLAQRSKDSTEEIKSIIEKLQSGTREAVQAMSAGLDQASQSVVQANKAGDSLDAITHTVSTISDMNVQIATASEEQAAVAEEINRNIINIVQIAEETSAGAQATAETTEHLATISMQLQKHTSSYNLGSD